MQETNDTWKPRKRSGDWIRKNDLETKKAKVESKSRDVSDNDDKDNEKDLILDDWFAWPRSRPVTWMNCLSRSACHSICCLSPTETPSSSESDATRFPLSESSVPYLHYPVPDNDISCSSHYLPEVAISLAVDSDLQPCLLSPWGQQVCQCCSYNFLRRGHLVFLITSDKDTYCDMSGQTNNLQTVKQVSSVICHWVDRKCTEGGTRPSCSRDYTWARCMSCLARCTWSSPWPPAAGRRTRMWVGTECARSGGEGMLLFVLLVLSNNQMFLCRYRKRCQRITIRKYGYAKYVERQIRLIRKSVTLLHYLFA